jgi:AraC-like DNA-binding protein
MKHARRLLLDGVSAADVALRCGFADQSHFNRHFKRFNAVTPMQYAHAHSPKLRTAGVRKTAGDASAVGDPSASLARSEHRLLGR